ncbi:barstar family protein [Auraticoccus cholistanensis]|uniref:barstar family protein n=1 Tax=Auraticoccus cholistanensis TaxID=2656650 RepID=UPI0018D208C3
MSDQDALAGLRRGDAGGVLRVLGEPDVVAGELAAAGWSVLTVRAATAAQLHAGLGAALGPRRYGANLDALWDVLADLDAPTALLWTGWDELVVAEPEAWRRLLDVLGRRAASTPPFAVLLLQAGGG